MILEGVVEGVGVVVQSINQNIYFICIILWG